MTPKEMQDVIDAFGLKGVHLLHPDAPMPNYFANEELFPGNKYVVRVWMFTEDKVKREELPLFVANILTKEEFSCWIFDKFKEYIKMNGNDPDHAKREAFEKEADEFEYGDNYHKQHNTHSAFPIIIVGSILALAFAFLASHIPTPIQAARELSELVRHKQYCARISVDGKEKLYCFTWTGKLP